MVQLMPLSLHRVLSTSAHHRHVQFKLCSVMHSVLHIVNPQTSHCHCLFVRLSRSWALQKRLNRSRCRLACGLGWDQGTTC